VIPAISVRQPWAGLIVSGVKDVENRTWRTSHRGRVLVHASARPDVVAQGSHGSDGILGANGAILGAVTLVDCLFDQSVSRWAEPGLWHWLLIDPELFAEPIPASGRLGIWHPSRTTCRQLRRVLQ